MGRRGRFRSVGGAAVTEPGGEATHAAHHALRQHEHGDDEGAQNRRGADEEPDRHTGQRDMGQRIGDERQPPRHQYRLQRHASMRTHSRTKECCSLEWQMRLLMGTPCIKKLVSTRIIPFQRQACVYRHICYSVQ